MALPRGMRRVRIHIVLALTVGALVMPWAGYWIAAGSESVTLRIPPP